MKNIVSIRIKKFQISSSYFCGVTQLCEFHSPHPHRSRNTFWEFIRYHNFLKFLWHIWDPQFWQVISYAGDSKETFYIGPIMDDEKLENDINQWPSKGIFLSCTTMDRCPLTTHYSRLFYIYIWWTLSVWLDIHSTNLFFFQKNKQLLYSHLANKLFAELFPSWKKTMQSYHADAL